MWGVLKDHPAWKGEFAQTMALGSCLHVHYLRLGLHSQTSSCLMGPLSLSLPSSPFQGEREIFSFQSPLSSLDQTCITYCGQGNVRPRLAKPTPGARSQFNCTQTAWLAWEEVGPQGKSGWGYKDKGTHLMAEGTDVH